MPYSLRVVPERKLAVIRWSGCISVWAEDELFPALIKHPGFRPGFGILFDMLDATPQATLGEFQASGARHENLEKDLAPAWICYVVAGEVNYGLARQYVAFHHETYATRHVTTNVDEALGWLSQFVGPLDCSVLDSSGPERDVEKRELDLAGQGTGGLFG